MKLNKRGVIVMWALVILVVLGFTYLTRDVCYVGNMPGNGQQSGLGRVR